MSIKLDTELLRHELLISQLKALREELADAKSLVEHALLELEPGEARGGYAANLATSRARAILRALGAPGRRRGIF